MTDMTERDPRAELFEATYRVRACDAGADNRVRLDAMARYLQDIAADMIEDSAFAESDPFWILRRTVMDVHRPLSLPGDVHVSRWCNAISTRWVTMRQTIIGAPETSPANPEPREPGLVETESFCIKVTPDGQVGRISEAALESLGAGATETRLRWRAMNPATPPEGRAGTPFAPRSSDIDVFGHVNNTIYWHIVEDALGEHEDLIAAPHRAVVEHLRPVPPATTVSVVADRDGDRLALWILLGDGTVAATATVGPLPAA